MKVDPLDYADHHPTPPEVYLIIEVADSSLKIDCDTKAKAYSQAGITDYWVLDVTSRQLYPIFRTLNCHTTKNGRLGVWD